MTNLGSILKSRDITLKSNPFGNRGIIAVTAALRRCPDEAALYHHLYHGGNDPHLLRGALVGIRWVGGDALGAIRIR